MKKWYMIDEVGTADSYDSFETELKYVNTRAEAEAAIGVAWDSLSDYDQNRRHAFYAVFCEADEDGILDYDTATEVITIK